MSKADSSIMLNNEKTELTIKNPIDDYEVSVETIPLYSLEFELSIDNAGNFTPLSNHGYTFEVKKDGADGTLLPSATPHKFEGIDGGTIVHIIAKGVDASLYEIVKWELKNLTNTNFSAFEGAPNEHTKNKLNKL